MSYRGPGSYTIIIIIMILNCSNDSIMGLNDGQLPPESMIIQHGQCFTSQQLGCSNSRGGTGSFIGSRVNIKTVNWSCCRYYFTNRLYHDHGYELRCCSAANYWTILLVIRGYSSRNVTVINLPLFGWINHNVLSTCKNPPGIPFSQAKL